MVSATEWSGTLTRQWSFCVCIRRGWTSTASLEYAGCGVVRQDKELAVVMYGLAAAQGVVKAQYRLGLCYEHGEGVDQHERTAVRLHTRAANKGDTDAQWRRGMCYEHGAGVERN